MRRIEWLLIGAGEIATMRVADALNDADGSHLRAVCDIQPVRAEELACKHGVKQIYTDVDTALRESGVDAVYVAVPVKYHFPLSMQVIRAGKHLLLEKPMGMNGSECLQLAKTVEDSDCTNACSYYRRLTGQYQYTKHMIDSGAIGEIVGGWVNYFLPLKQKQIDSAPWFLDKSVAGGGILYHLGSHIFDIVAGLFGMPQSVFATCGNFKQGIDVEDHASIILKLKSGAPFTINFNWNSCGIRHDAEILGTKGRIHWPEWPPHGDKPVELFCDDRRTEQIVSNRSNFHLPLISNFITAVFGNRKPVCSFSDACCANIIIDAVYQSSTEGREIVLEGEDDE